MTCASEEGKKLMESASLLENAAFLNRWAAEVYGEWSTWMSHTFPGCRVGHKKKAQRIVHEIQDMVKEADIARPEDGWKKITDMLRAEYSCSTA